MNDGFGLMIEGRKSMQPVGDLQSIAVREISQVAREE